MAFRRTDNQRETRFLSELRLEAAKAKFSCAVQEEPFNPLGLSRLIPITDDLSEAKLIEGVREMNFAMLIIRDTIAVRLEATLRE